MTLQGFSPKVEVEEKLLFAAVSPRSVFVKAV
jgi:hypothetical protein